MRLSGEEIRQEAEKREQTCSKGMKDSFYYGFIEGAKWVLKLSNEGKNGLTEFGEGVEWAMKMMELSKKK